MYNELLIDPIFNQIINKKNTDIIFDKFITNSLTKQIQQYKYNRIEPLTWEEMIVVSYLKSSKYELTYFKLGSHKQGYDCSVKSLYNFKTYNISIKRTKIKNGILTISGPRLQKHHNKEQAALDDILSSDYIFLLSEQTNTQSSIYTTYVINSKELFNCLNIDLFYQNKLKSEGYFLNIAKTTSYQFWLKICTKKMQHILKPILVIEKKITTYV